MKIFKLILFYLVSFTWGILESTIGLLVMLPFIFTGQVQVEHGRLCGVFPKAFGFGWGFTLGCFVFVAYDCANDKYLICHELGHTLQQLIWGPLMPFVISIPSVIRFWYRESIYKKGLEPKTAYDDIWFEGQATRWGTKRYWN